jgi:hypothetical protein
LEERGERQGNGESAEKAAVLMRSTRHTSSNGNGNTFKG